MIYGVGTDILSAERIRTIPEDDVFCRTVFTDAEKEQSKESGDSRKFFTGRFAAKEAVFKALSPDPDTSRLNEIEILNDANGKPVVCLHGNMQKLADEAGITKIHVSVSHETEYSLAFAVAEM